MKKKIFAGAVTLLSVAVLAACSNSEGKDIVTMKGNTITVNEFYDQVKNNGAAQQVLLQMAIKDIFEEKYGKDVKDKDVKDKIGLADYKKLLDQADSEITDTQARYEKYAEAQAWLTDSALFLPVQSGGANPIFRKTVPFTGPFSFVGHKGNADNYKYVELQKEPVTAKQYQELYEKWLKEKAESNKKAQEDLANHIQ